MKYYNPLIDKAPVEIKVIQMIDRRGRCEITRDLESSGKERLF